MTSSNQTDFQTQKRMRRAAVLIGRLTPVPTYLANTVK